jgi:hypothetical protein
MDIPPAIAAALADPDFVHPSPQCVGPPQWQALHNLGRTFDGSPEKAQAIVAYVTALGDLFPCPKCAPHWKALAPTVDTTSQAGFLKWTFDAHNQVNARLGVPTYSYQQAIDAMNAACAPRKPAQPPPATTTTKACHAPPLPEPQQGSDAVQVATLVGMVVVVLLLVAAIALVATRSSRATND